MNDILEYERRFKEITGLDQDLSVFPITELAKFPIRKELSKSHGEVFTPPSIVDKMLLTSKPKCDAFNLDLCAGRGQFTIRMLRKFTLECSNFSIKDYLKKYHWFNEMNEESCREILSVFGVDINLAVGPAQELRSYPMEIDGIWKRGIYKFHEFDGSWKKVDENLNYVDFKEKKQTALF